VVALIFAIGLGSGLADRAYLRRQDDQRKRGPRVGEQHRLAQKKRRERSAEARDEEGTGDAPGRRAEETDVDRRGARAPTA
jgi:hypothetical protein